MDIDIAQNLLWGIDAATNSFSDPKTSPLAFEMAGELMKLGAVREQNASLRTAFTRPLTTFPQSNLGQVSQARPVQRNPQAIAPDFGQPTAQNPSLSTEQNQPIAPVKKSTLEQVTSLDQQSSLEAPDDWLAPKIYKGSTNF